MSVRVTMESHRFSMEFLSLPRNSMDERQDVHGIPWNSVEFHGFSVEFLSIPWNIMATRQSVPWNTMEFHGIP
jgi:hypothetical protein